MQSRHPTSAHLGLILHYILVDIRNLSCEPKQSKRIAELADFAEIVPLQFVNRDEGYLDIIVSGLRQLANRDPMARRYAAVLDMTEEDVFRTIVRDTNIPVPVSDDQVVPV